MWAGASLALAIVLGATAWMRSRAAAPNFYEAEMYAAGPTSHRRFAAAFAVLAALAAAALFVPAIPAVAVTAVTVLAAILYGATFARGASGEDE